MDTNEILSAIHSGALDDDLKVLESALDNRKRFNAERVVLSAKVGDRIRISAVVRPRFLANREATVVRTEHGRKGYTLVVDLDHPVGRWHKGINLPASLVGSRVDAS